MIRKEIITMPCEGGERDVGEGVGRTGGQSGMAAWVAMDRKERFGL